MSISDRVVEERMPHWICPECRTFYFGASQFRFCPACADKKQLAEKEYWDKKATGQRSVALDIVSQILAKNNAR